MMKIDRSMQDKQSWLDAKTLEEGPMEPKRRQKPTVKRAQNLMHTLIWRAAQQRATVLDLQKTYGKDWVNLLDLLSDQERADLIEVMKMGQSNWEFVYRLTMTANYSKQEPMLVEEQHEHD